MTSVSACLMQSCIIALAQYQEPEMNKAFRGNVAVERTVQDILRKHTAKQKTRKALRGAVIQKKDCLCILLTDFRKALIF